MSPHTMPISGQHDHWTHDFISSQLPSTVPSSDFFQRIGLLLQAPFISPLSPHRPYIH